MQTLENNVRRFLQQNLGETFDQKHYILALSGGMDSMVLLDVFTRNNLSFSVAHVNYHLRGKESIEDEAFVVEYCRKNGMELYIKSIENFKQEIPNRTSLQMYARTIRYDFLKEVAQKKGNAYIVTAHHFNDSLETFLINFSRGSGLKGLTGISEQKNTILRPLLSFTKAEITEYAQHNNLIWREDSSNATDDYTRNDIRHNIIPKLQEISDNSLQKYQKSISILQEYDSFFSELYEDFKTKILQSKNELLYIPKDDFGNAHSLFQYQLLSDFGFSNKTEQQKIQKTSVGRIFSNSNYELNVDRSHFIIRKVQFAEFSSIEITHFPFYCEEFQLHIDEDFIKKNAEIHQISIENWSFPLTIRKRKIGDFLRRKNVGNVLLSKYLKDKKIAQFEKDALYVIAHNQSEILCYFTLYDN